MWWAPDALRNVVSALLQDHPVCELRRGVAGSLYGISGNLSVCVGSLQYIIEIVKGHPYGNTFSLDGRLPRPFRTLVELSS